MIPEPTPQSESSFPPLPSQLSLAGLKMDGQRCPSCGQEIPLAKLEEISGKIALRDREQALAITTKLEQRYEAEKAQASAKADAELDLERRQGTAREAAVREQVQKDADLLLKQKLAEAERTREQLQAGWQTRFEQEETTRKAAEQTKESLQLQMQQLRQDSASALEAAKAEANAREIVIRAEANKSAEAAVAEKLAALEASRLKSESALQAKLEEAESGKIAAEQKGVELLSQLDEAQKGREAEVAKIKAEAATQAARIRQEATDAAGALFRDKIAASEELAAAANAKALETETKLIALTHQHGAEMAEGLNSQREIMEKAKEDAVNAEKAKAFDENQKLSTKVNELQRALDKKTNEELGEGAEVDVFEALKKEFPEDRITRIAKGAAGADISHIVVMRGKECGTIIYDSKNHKAFRHDHVAKLKSDQLAAKARACRSFHPSVPAGNASASYS